MINIPLHDHVAILIDGDNAQLPYLERVLKNSEYYGQLRLSRVYGDWNKSPLSAWREKIDTLNIERIQVDRVRKNATDHRLLIEVGEILGAFVEYENSVQVFIIVSGDGDFTPACKFIQERGLQVVGIGNRDKTSPSLRELCDTFYFLEDLDHEAAHLEKLHPIPPSEVRGFFLPLVFAYHQRPKKHNWDWVSYSQLDAKLRELDPDFETRFGKYELSEWLKNFDQEFESCEQMIRRIDTHPEMTRFGYLFKAYKQTRQSDGRAHQGQIGKALRELDPIYESRFGSKKLSEWLEAYPHVFKFSENYVWLVRG
jgi:hypothetical protein